MEPASIREVFLSTSVACLALLHQPRLGAAWNQSTVLPMLSVKALTGHLVGGILQVERFLDSEVPEVPHITAAAYYAPQVQSTNLSDPLNIAVRNRGEAIGEVGLTELIDQVERSLERLTTRLFSEPDERAIEATGSSGLRGRVLLLDEYLLVRLVEQTVHVDDLLASVPGLRAELPASAYRFAIATLVEAAKRRHGDLAVLRALVRRERDDVDALRVL